MIPDAEVPTVLRRLTFTREHGANAASICSSRLGSSVCFGPMDTYAAWALARPDLRPRSSDTSTLAGLAFTICRAEGKGGDADRTGLRRS